MIRQDDRTEEEKKTMTLAVVGRDAFLSGWGAASGGYSRAAWAFDQGAVNDARVFNWVKSRSEMRFVSLVSINDYRPPRGTSHFHIYKVDVNHPAAKY
jgi:hypothetical protein